jgi:hypothetical protein
VGTNDFAGKKSPVPFNARNASGVLSVSSLSVTYDAVRYSPFNLSVASSQIVSDCSACSSSFGEMVFADDACHIPLIFNDTLAHEGNVTCDATVNVTIHARDARKLWDREEVVGRFWVIQTGGHFTLGDTDALITNHLLNSSSNAFINGSGFDLGQYQNDNLYYYSGDIHNNGSSYELVNSRSSYAYVAPYLDHRVR